MTLEELARQYDRGINQIKKILTSNGFTGIYKPTHDVPDEAVQVVVEVLNNKSIAPAFAPAEEPKTIEKTEPKSNHAGEIKTRLSQSTQALQEQVIHQTNERHQTVVNNAVVMGALDALNQELAYQSAFMSTSQALYEADLRTRQETTQVILNKLADPDFLQIQTPQESFYKSSKLSASDELRNDWMNIV